MSSTSTNINLLTPLNKLPLYGKRIMITAPRNYGIRLSEAIINQVGIPIFMPTIETCLLEDYYELDNALKSVDKFDWITFTSRNGIDAFFTRLNGLNLPLSELKAQVAAIGKDGERLADLGVNVALIPEVSSPEGIIKELTNIPGIEGQKVLVPIPKVMGIPEPDVVPNFLLGLKQLGLEVTAVPVYVTRCLDKKIYEVELNLISEGKIDVVAFSSTGEISAFLQMVEERNYDKCIIACFGPVTAANAAKLGLKVAIVAEDYSSFAGYGKAISAFFTGQGGERSPC